VPAKNYGHDLPAMLQAIGPTTRLVFIANPNNPTGTFLDAAALDAFLAVVPEGVIVVLDEAYNEYLPPAEREHSLGWLKRYRNLILTRTFSKAYGLAGLRVGYAAAAPEVADLMNRVRQPFNVNSISLAAAAAGLEDHEFVERSYRLNNDGMAQITAGLTRLGLDYIPSSANFVSFRMKEAAGVFQRLLKAGVIVRPIAGYGMPDHLRVSIGLPDENARFLASLEQALVG